MKFTPNFKSLGNLPPYSQEEIKNEISLTRCDKEFAIDKGGPILKKFIENFLIENDRWVIDTRLHYLETDWYPSHKHWHIDDTFLLNDIPDYVNLPKSNHIMVIVGNNSCPEFINEPISIPKDLPYIEWDPYISQFKIYKISPYEVIEFNAQDFHRATGATKEGYRFFIRASRNTLKPIENKINDLTYSYVESKTKSSKILHHKHNSQAVIFGGI